MKARHLLIDEAARLERRLTWLRVEAECAPPLLAGDAAAAAHWQRLVRLEERAGARLGRRWQAVMRAWPNRRGRADTKDRPYAVGGRGRRGW